MEIGLVLAIGVMVMVGFFGGKLAHRFRFPMVTGYIVVGLLLSPSLLNIIPESVVQDLEVFTAIALGIIAYSIGDRLKWSTVKSQEKSIFTIGILQAVGAWVVTMVVIALVAPLFLPVPGASFTNTYLPMGLLMGALASATAPAVILALVREYRARGVLTTVLLSVVAFDDAIAIIFFSIAMGIAQPLSLGVSSSLSQMLLFPVLKIIGSIALGVVLGYGLVYVSRMVRERSLLLAIVLGTIFLCVGIARYFDISEILASMVIGFIVGNRGHRPEMLNVIDDIEDFVFAMFFVLAGLHFKIDVMQTAGLLALLVVAGRFGGKYLGTRVGATMAGSPAPVKKYLGLALMPAAGVTLGLALLIYNRFPDFGELVYNGILASVIVNELTSPLLVKYVIYKAGEQHTG